MKRGGNVKVGGSGQGGRGEVRVRRVFGLGKRVRFEIVEMGE